MKSLTELRSKFVRAAGCRHGAACLSEQDAWDELVRQKYCWRCRALVGPGECSRGEKGPFDSSEAFNPDRALARIVRHGLGSDSRGRVALDLVLRVEGGDLIVHRLRSLEEGDPESIREAQRQAVIPSSESWFAVLPPALFIVSPGRIDRLNLFGETAESSLTLDTVPTGGGRVCGFDGGSSIAGSTNGRPVVVYVPDRRSESPTTYEGPERPGGWHEPLLENGQWWFVSREGGAVLRVAAVGHPAEVAEHGPLVPDGEIQTAAPIMGETAMAIGFTGTECGVAWVDLETAGTRFDMAGADVPTSYSLIRAGGDVLWVAGTRAFLFLADGGSRELRLRGFPADSARFHDVEQLGDASLFLMDAGDGAKTVLAHVSVQAGDLLARPMMTVDVAPNAIRAFGLIPRPYAREHTLVLQSTGRMDLLFTRNS